MVAAEMKSTLWLVLMSIGVAELCGLKPITNYQIRCTGTSEELKAAASINATVRIHVILSTDIQTFL